MRGYFGIANGSSSDGTTVNCGVCVTNSTKLPLQTGKKYVDVQLLSREHLYLAVDVKCKVRDLFSCVCANLGLQDRRLFALAIFVDGEYRFLDEDEKLSKCGAAPKNWSKIGGWGTDFDGNPFVILYLRVHTYVEFVRVINCPVALYHYYLQLRENVRVQWEPSWIREERCFETAALALQADFGDFDQHRHSATGYFRPELYFPLWVVNTRGMDFVVRHMPSMHQDLHGINSDEAKIRFCREVSRPPWPVNMHLYSLRKCKSDAQDNIYMGITARGLEFFKQNSRGERDHMLSFLWSRIGKVAFDRRKFTVCNLDGRKVVFYTSSDEKSRYLLLFCRAVHQKVMSLQADIAEAQKREFQERKQFRESYIYSDSTDLVWVRDQGNFHHYSYPMTGSVLNLQSRTTDLISGQRVSLVSDASSNTTSGIVSDRQHNHDDSENENVLASFDDDIDYDTCESSQIFSSSSAYLSSAPCSQKGSGRTCESSNNNFSTGSIDGGFGVDHDEKKDANDAFLNGFVERRESNVGGPSSDRTMTALSDDGQSIGTISTTEKLEDIATDADSNCVENRKLSSVLSYDDKSLTHPIDDDVRLAELANSAEFKIHRELSALIAKSMENLRMESSSPFSSTTPVSAGDESSNNVGLLAPKKVPESGSMRSQISIAELRNKTLQGFLSAKCSSKAEIPTLSSISLQPRFSNTDDEQSSAEGANSKSCRMMKSLATQTNTAYLPCFNKSKETESSTPTLSDHQPCVVQINSNEATKNVNNHSSQKSYRVISALSTSADLSDSGHMNIDCNEKNQQQPVLMSPPKMGVSSLHATNDRKASSSNVPLFKPTYQSFSMSNLPVSHNIPEQKALPPTTSALSFHDPPNYEQAMQQKAERQANRRWLTISGFNVQDLARFDITNNVGCEANSAHLHQAQSEPGLAISVDHLPNHAGNISDQQMQMPSYTIGGVAMSSNRLASYQTSYNNSRVVQPPAHQSTSSLMNCNNYYGQQHMDQLNHQQQNCLCQHQQQQQPQCRRPTSTFDPYAYTTQPHNGLYVKHPTKPLRQIPNSAFRLHPAVSRVQSMQHEAAMANQIRRQMMYEENQRRVAASNLHQQSYHQHTMSPSSSGSSSNVDRKLLYRRSSDTHDSTSISHTRYCSTCHENHQPSKVDLNQLKTLIREQALDFPMIRALCADNTLNKSTSAAMDAAAEEKANGVVRRRRRAPPAPLDLNGNEHFPHSVRPQSWHESSLINMETEYAGKNFSNAEPMANGHYMPSSYSHQLPQHPSPLYQHPFQPYVITQPPQSPMRFASTPNLFATDYMVSSTTTMALPPPPPYHSPKTCDGVVATSQPNVAAAEFYGNPFQVQHYNFYEQAIR